MDCAAGETGRSNYLGWISKKEVERVDMAWLLLHCREREQQAKIQTQEAAGRCADDNWFTMAVR